MTLSIPPQPVPAPVWTRSAHPRTSVRPVDPTAQLRIGDLERTQVCDQLSHHYGLGRLDAEEVEHRLGLAMRARTAGDLSRLTRDLPVDGPTARPSPTRSAASAVVATVVLITSFGLCMLMILGSTFIDPGWAFGALLGGTIAVIGGIAIGHLWHWYRDR